MVAAGGATGKRVRSVPSGESVPFGRRCAAGFGGGRKVAGAVCGSGEPVRPVCAWKTVSVRPAGDAP